MASPASPTLSAAEPDLSTKLAIERTRLAHERTLMAWVRTATSLISFGFTIYKFFEYLRESQSAPTSGALGPREFAVLMIGIGITAMILATIGHRRSMRALRAEYGALIPYSLGRPRPGSLASFCSSRCCYECSPTTWGQVRHAVRAEPRTSVSLAQVRWTSTQVSER